MKQTFIVAACALALSTAGAMAQSSQGDAGAGTRNNREIGASGMSGAAASTTTTTGSAASRTGSTMTKDGTARNPSSQGNAGPGTDPTRPAGR